MSSHFELADAIKELIERARLYRSCVTCQYFDESLEICSVAGQRPPARIIATGCGKYLEEPPF